MSTLSADITRDFFTLAAACVWSAHTYIISYTFLWLCVSLVTCVCMFFFLLLNILRGQVYQEKTRASPRLSQLPEERTGATRLREQAEPDADAAGEPGRGHSQRPRTRGRGECWWNSSPLTKTYTYFGIYFFLFELQTHFSIIWSYLFCVCVLWTNGITNSVSPSLYLAFL